jgi:hypothetical protein
LKGLQNILVTCYNKEKLCHTVYLVFLEQQYGICSIGSSMVNMLTSS